MDGVVLSPSEDEFVVRITEELEHFMLQGQHNSVLLFPPLPSRLRYLIHRTVDNVDLLSSFSVGEGWRRRTVICHSAVRLPSDTSDQKPSSYPPRPPRPLQPWGWGGRGGRLRHGGDIHGDSSRSCVGSGRIKRPPWRKPDKPLYVPKVMRKKAEAGGQESPAGAASEAGGDVARGEEICLKASGGDTQENLGKSENSPGDVSLALSEQQEPGEESVPEKSIAATSDQCPPCGADVPSSESSNDFAGQGSQAKDCSGSLSSTHNKTPTGAEDQSCDNVGTPEGSKIPCQLGAEDQSSRDAGVMVCGTPSSLPEGRSRSCWTDPAAAEPSAMSLVLQDQDKSCAAAKSLESGGKVSPPEEQGEDFVNTGVVEGGKSFSEAESQEGECSSIARAESSQNTLEAKTEPLAPSELVCGANPSAPEDQNEHQEDASTQPHVGKEPVAQEEDKECLGLSGRLWREWRVSAGDEERAAGHGQSSLEGDCTTELFAEIVGHLTVKDISIEKISLDYSSYGDAQLSDRDFGHVTEIYDFSPSLKTENILEIFSDFHESGFKIQWVDDTHALGIFSSVSTASQALGRRYPSLKIRPLIHATKQSKLKALQRPKLLQLGKERPQTDTVVAKRLVSRALGLKHKQQGSSGTQVLPPESLDQEEE
ncbi:R3H and coiled-coil domain-containing protein 1 [Porphyrio hochstetteri]